MTTVVPFPLAAHDSPGVRDQRWPPEGLPPNAVCLRPPPPRIAPTPERVLLQAIVGQLTPKAYTGLLSRLARQRAKGCALSGVAFLMATEPLQ